MYDLVDGVILIAVGIYFYLGAKGKIQISKTKEKSDEWRNKYGPLIQVLAPIMILFGIFRFFQVL